MSNVTELLRADELGLSFGDYSLTTKTKLTDFPYEGATYKVKTFHEITRLEKNGGVAYESVPGSAVHGYVAAGGKVTFSVEAEDDIQITLEMEPKKDYTVSLDGTSIGTITSSLGGKVSFSIELEAGQLVKVEVCEA